MKTKIKKELFYGIFLAARQVQLSLDRALFDDWENLTAFFSSRNYIADLVQTLDGLASAYSDGESGYRCHRFKNIFRSVVFGGYFMSVGEINFVRHALFDFLALLKKPASHEEIVNMRLKFCQIEDSMRKRIGREVSCLDAVEHFNRASHLECKEIHDFLGPDWARKL